MASALSYELFEAKQGVANGIATLDATVKVPVAQLPDVAISTYKGVYADEAALIAAYETASQADYAYVTATLSYWYWNPLVATGSWVNQQIGETAYGALSDAQKGAVPYIVVAD